MTSSDIVVFACDACGDCFATQQFLDEHVAKKHAKRAQGKHQCVHCPYSSDLKANVTRHVRKHTGERPFVCGVCGKGFGEKGTLLAHHLVHTEEKPYGCAQCGRRFNSASSAARHAKLHADARPYACRHCGWRFNEKYSLRAHLRTHLRKAASAP
ncbi:zinc finger X-chromosomal protein-like [Haemaphysalis longicornis]